MSWHLAEDLLPSLVAFGWNLQFPLWMKESLSECGWMDVQHGALMGFSMSTLWWHLGPCQASQVERAIWLSLASRLRIHLDLETWFGLWLALCAERGLWGIETMLKSDVTVDVFKYLLAQCNLYSQLFVRASCALRSSYLSQSLRLAHRAEICALRILLHNCDICFLGASRPSWEKKVTHRSYIGFALNHPVCR